MFLVMFYCFMFIHGTSLQNAAPGEFIYPSELVTDDASDGTVETLAYSGDGADDAWSACGTEAGQEE